MEKCNSSISDDLMLASESKLLSTVHGITHCLQQWMWQPFPYLLQAQYQRAGPRPWCPPRTSLWMFSGWLVCLVDRGVVMLDCEDQRSFALFPLTAGLKPKCSSSLMISSRDLLVDGFWAVALGTEASWRCVVVTVKTKDPAVECCICIALMSFDWPNEPRSPGSTRPRLIGWLAMLEHCKNENLKLLVSLGFLSKMNIKH